MNVDAECKSLQKQRDLHKTRYTNWALDIECETGICADLEILELSCAFDDGSDSEYPESTLQPT